MSKRKKKDKKRDKERYDPGRQGESRSQACTSMLAAIGLFGGIFMIWVGKKLGPECTMEAIDALTPLDEEEEVKYDENGQEIERPGPPLGNLPSWFVYAGTVFLLCSLCSCCSVGAVPEGLRESHPILGGCFVNCTAGMCGRAVLIALFFVAAVCNLIGSLWLHLARMNRTHQNSQKYGPNYCHPLLWDSAWIITYFFWVVVVLSAIALVANFFAGIKYGTDAKFDIGVVTKKGKLKELRAKESARGQNDIFVV